MLKEVEVGAGVGKLVPLHKYLRGGVPPEAFAVQVTFSPRSTVDGEAEQETVIGLPETTKLKVVCLFKGEPVTVMG